MDNFVMGLDLGQSQDFTAISIIECIPPESGKAEETRYHLRHLERPPLGTLYPAIVERVKQLLDTPPLGPRTTLVADQTGCGRPVIDMFRVAGLKPYAITIHGGDTITYEGRAARVPKRDLIGQLVALFQSGHFKMASTLPLAPVIKDELLNFKMKINIATGADTFESWRERDHDDCVLSIALATWKAQRDRRQAAPKVAPAAMYSPSKHRGIAENTGPVENPHGEIGEATRRRHAEQAAQMAAALRQSGARTATPLYRPSRHRV